MSTCKYTPHDYQVVAERYIYEHPDAGLFLDMGLGKTVITLTAIANLMWDVNKVLIIAPKRPAFDTWPEELSKWDHLSDLKYIKVQGTPKQRKAALASSADLYIINRENVAWLAGQYTKSTWPFDCVVVDELSSFKSSKSQRFRALRKVRPAIRRFIGLTGTPMANSYMDLWAELYLIDGGKALGKTITGYRDQFFTPGRRNGAIVYDWNLRPDADAEILKRIKPVCLTMKTEDYLQLPEFIELIKNYSLSEKTKKLYESMEKDLFLEIDKNCIDAVNAAALTSKLLQISSGAIYTEDKKTVQVHAEKLEMLDSILEETEGENVIVFYNFQHEQQRLKQRYPDAVDVKEPGAIANWKAGKIPMLLAHPASAGHGLNLQSGGRVNIWFGLTTSLELYQQAIKRLHRQGQTKPVLNYVLLASGTYEETVYHKILKNKEKKQDALIEALKARLKEVQHAR